MRGVWQGLTLSASVMIGCASAGSTIDHANDCRPGEQACHNARWQQTESARRHQAAMKDARRREDDVWRRQVLAKAKKESRARAAVLARLDAAWWCFEGQDDTRPFGECRPTPTECSATRDQRIAAGLRAASPCEPYASAACFNATPSLKKGPGLYCFPQPQLCSRYRDKAIARSLHVVSDCGLL